MGTPAVLQYDTPYPLYGIAFSSSSQHPHRVALSSLIAGPSNKLLVADVLRASPMPEPYAAGSFDPQLSYGQLAQTSLVFPATKVGWEPNSSLINAEHEGGRGELLATAGDVLRIWEVSQDYGSRRNDFIGSNGWTGGGSSHALTARSVLSNSKSTNPPPVTSFSWNAVSPKSIVTCSSDTTATLWDINTSQALTQLIAHDRAVYDLSWLPQSSDIFVSVGADGSLRAFDLRTLEHSTILYESSGDTPLARIAFSNQEQHMLACFGMNDTKVLILDMRSPGQPVAELVGHQAPLGGIAWGAGPSNPSTGSSAGGWIASCGDDHQLLLYDLSGPIPEPATKPSRPNSKPQASPNPIGLSAPSTPANARTPSPAPSVALKPVRAWTADSEINNLAFTADGSWVGCVSGGRLDVLKV